jgi:hypothetical protein
MGPSLQWIALLSGDAEDVDFAAATGVHDGEAVIKQLLVGAKAVQICSTLYRNGLGRASEMLNGLSTWMDGRGGGTGYPWAVALAGQGATATYRVTPGATLLAFDLGVGRGGSGAGAVRLLLDGDGRPPYGAAARLRSV